MSKYIETTDQIGIRLLLVNGKTQEFKFDPQETAQDVVDSVYSNWPTAWGVEERPTANILRLIYQGRFLHGSVKLAALDLSSDRSTVMHLVPRENLPGPPQPDENKSDKAQPRHCCIIS